MHHHIEGPIGQILGVVAFPKVYLTGQKEPKQFMGGLLFEVFLETGHYFFLGQTGIHT